MKSFNRDNKFSGSRGQRSFKGRDSDSRDFSPREGGRPSLHDAVCAECGKDCKVPFIPSSGKPVYCSDCFEQKDRNNDRGDRSNFRSSNFAPRRSFTPNNERNDSSQKLDQKLDMINIKLDKLLNLLNPKAEKTNTSESSVTPEVVSTETVVATEGSEVKAAKPKTKKAKTKKVVEEPTETPVTE